MSSAALQGIHVLVVEDNYLVASSVVSTLGAEGALIDGMVGTCSDALALLEEGAGPDVVLLDVNLGGEMSHSVADALRIRAIPFIMITGYDEQCLHPAYAGAPICQKPFSMSSLIHQIRRSARAA